MTKLIIEGLKPKYAALLKATKCQPYEQGKEDAVSALNELCRLIISTTTTYEGMNATQLVMNIEEDLRFVQGQMTEKEEQARIEYHLDLIEQQKKELQEFVEQQRQKATDGANSTIPNL